MGGFFSKKAFHGGTNLFGQIYVVQLFYMGELMIGLCKGSGIFTNAFSNYRNTIDPKVFSRNGGIGVILRLIVKRFQMMCHAQFRLC